MVQRHKRSCALIFAKSAVDDGIDPMADGSAGTSVAKYVGYKISRVRWKPQPSGAIRPSDVFVAGSWDDEVRVN